MASGGELTRRAPCPRGRRVIPPARLSLPQLTQCVQDRVRKFQCVHSEVFTAARSRAAARARAAGSVVLCGDLAASWSTVTPSSTSAPSTCYSGFCSSFCWQCADSAGPFHQRDCGRPVGAREARRRARARGARGGSARFEPDPVAAATGGDSAGWPCRRLSSGKKYAHVHNHALELYSITVF